MTQSKSKPYDDLRNEILKDPEVAAEYLKADPLALSLALEKCREALALKSKQADEDLKKAKKKYGELPGFVVAQSYASAYRRALQVFNKTAQAQADVQAYWDVLGHVLRLEEAGALELSTTKALTPEQRAEIEWRAPKGE